MVPLGPSWIHQYGRAQGTPYHPRRRRDDARGGGGFRSKIGIPRLTGTLTGASIWLCRAKCRCSATSSSLACVRSSAKLRCEYVWAVRRLRRYCCSDPIEARLTPFCPSAVGSSAWRFELLFSSTFGRIGSTRRRVAAILSSRSRSVLPRWRSRATSSRSSRKRMRSAIPAGLRSAGMRADPPRA
jgi:hypothetical protein